LKNKLHILNSELPEDGQQLRPKGAGGLTNKSFVQQVDVKFCICLTEVYVIKDNINAFNKTLNKPSKAVPPCWTRIMRFCPPQETVNCVYTIPCQCGRSYTGETGRPWAVRLGEHRQNLEGHLERSR